MKMPSRWISLTLDGKPIAGMRSIAFYSFTESELNMFESRKANKIKKDLEVRFPKARFKVTVKKGDDVTVEFVGGHNYSDEFQTDQQAVDELVKVIRQTIPEFEWLDYDTSEGETVYSI